MELVTKNVTLDKESDDAVEQVREDLHLGTRGYSAALRIIIREWAEKKQEEVLPRQA